VHRRHPIATHDERRPGDGTLYGCCDVAPPRPLDGYEVNLSAKRTERIDVLRSIRRATEGTETDLMPRPGEVPQHVVGPDLRAGIQGVWHKMREEENPHPSTSVPQLPMNYESPEEHASIALW
jgi:hypothetical protein